MARASHPHYRLAATRKRFFLRLLCSSFVKVTAASLTKPEREKTLAGGRCGPPAHLRHRGWESLGTKQSRQRTMRPSKVTLRGRPGGSEFGRWK